MKIRSAEYSSSWCECQTDTVEVNGSVFAAAMQTALVVDIAMSPQLHRPSLKQVHVVLVIYSAPITMWTSTMGELQLSQPNAKTQKNQQMLKG